MIGLYIEDISCVELSDWLMTAIFKAKANKVVYFPSITQFVRITSVNLVGKRCFCSLSLPLRGKTQPNLSGWSHITINLSGGSHITFCLSDLYFNVIFYAN